MWHMQNNQRIRPNKLGFMKVKSCLTDLIFSYVKVISLKSCGCWDVVKLFTLSPIAFWRNWLLMAWAGVLSDKILDRWAEGGVVNGVTVCSKSLLVFPRAQYWGQFFLIPLLMTWMSGSSASLAHK